MESWAGPGNEAKLDVLQDMFATLYQLLTSAVCLSVRNFDNGSSLHWSGLQTKPYCVQTKLLIGPCSAGTWQIWRPLVHGENCLTQAEFWLQCEPVYSVLNQRDMAPKEWKEESGGSQVEVE